MATENRRSILRDALVGFLLGVVVVATVGLVGSKLAPSPAAAAPAPR